MSAVEAVEAFPLRTIGYVRISRDSTGQQAGVGRQEDACRALVEELGWEMSEVLIENDTSAFSGTKRPEYERLLELIESGQIDAVVAYHPDRLYRRLRDLTRLTDALRGSDVLVRTVKAGDIDLSTASGIFQAQILGAAAEHESARTGERIAMSQESNRKKGRAHGGARPYGFNRIGPGELEVREDEAAVIREAAAKVLNGSTLKAVYDDLNRRGITTVNGSFWRDRGLRMVLTSPRIAGLVPREGDVYGAATWEPIIEREDWERLRMVLASQKRGPSPRSFLLSGFVWCGECGYRLHSNSGKTRRRYACQKGVNPNACAGVVVSCDRAEQEVVDRVLTLIRGADLADITAEKTESASLRLVESIEQDEAELEDLAAQRGRRQITAGEWSAFRAPVVERLARSRAELAQIGTSKLPPDLLHVDEEAFDALPFDQKRDLLDIFISRVIVHKSPVPGHWSPDRIEVVWKA